MKRIEKSNELRELISSGVQKLTDTVKVTMGPLGRNVMIQRENDQPFLTKDGVTVAQEVELEDSVENMAAQIVKEVSFNTAYEAGDGTTTSTVLTNAIYQLGLKKITSGTNVVRMKKGMDIATEKIVNSLREQSRSVSSNEELRQIATISANGDKAIGDLIAEAMEKVGRDGIITVEEAPGVVDILDFTEGLKFNRGYMSPNFITNIEKEIADLQSPYILISDIRIGHLAHLLPILEKVQKTGRPLLIISDDFDPEALNTVVINKVRGIMNITVVKAPGFGDGKIDQLNDIALACGATIFGNSSGRTFESGTLEDLGQASRVVVTKDDTTIIGGAGDKDLIEEIANAYRSQIESMDEGDAKISLEKRLARISGGVAVIKVGAQTEVEMREKKDRYDDAVSATKAAVAEGIVIGGGFALFQTVSELEIPKDIDEDERNGMSVIYDAVSAPLEQICENAGYNAEEVKSNIKRTNQGFDVTDGKVKNFFEAGIIDPLKVTRIALINAVSSASTLLTTETSINPDK